MALRKAPEFEFDPDDPFKNDCLGLRGTAENLSRLIKTISQPFVLSINAPWGAGKTTFIRMWMRSLENEGHPCIYFNAWENDFVEDPFVGFVGEIQERMGDWPLPEEAKKDLARRWTAVKEVGKKIIRKGIPLAIRVGTAGIIDLDLLTEVAKIGGAGKEVGDAAAKWAEERLEKYSTGRNELEEFKNKLAEFSAVIGQSKETKSPIVFFVDELDRCRPNYAVFLLERIKHLFGVGGIVFVLGIDKDQIIHSIKSLYGIGMDANGYLRRFIDLEFRLPYPACEKFGSYLSRRFNTEEVFSPRPEARSSNEKLIETFARLAKLFNLSLRVQEQCFTEVNLALRIASYKTGIYPLILPFLVVLKTHHYELFEKLLRKEISVEKIEDYLQGLERGQDFIDEYRYWHVLKACLYVNLLSEDKFNEKVKFLSDRLRSLSESSRERVHLDRLVSIIGTPEHTYEMSGVVKEIGNKIRMLEGFELG